VEGRYTLHGPEQLDSDSVLKSRRHLGFSGTRIIYTDVRMGHAFSGYRPLESNGGAPAPTGNSPSTTHSLPAGVSWRHGALSALGQRVPQRAQAVESPHLGYPHPVVETYLSHSD
jgi:hypothetical protein